MTKPFELDALRIKVRNLLEKTELEREVERLRDEVEDRQQLGELVGRSDVMRDIFRTVERIAKAEATVLVTGESGTGKELVARAIHDLSSRADGPFVAVNCGAIPRELIESELFGHEKGAFTGGDGSTHRPHRVRGRRHALPRRDRRARPRGPGQAPACAPGTHLRARRLEPIDLGRRAGS